MKSIEIELLLKAFQAEKDANQAVRGSTINLHYHFDEPVISVYRPGGDYKDVVLFFTDGETFTTREAEEEKHPDFDELKTLIQERFFLEYKPFRKK